MRAMAPRVTVFSINGHDGIHENFTAPNVQPNDLVGAPMFPTPDFFARPADLEPGMKLTVRLNPEDPMFGQVFGYIAPKHQCILDLDPNECWMVPPSPTNYEFAHQGTTVLSDGSELRTANIGGGAGHAATALGWKQVPAFYENTSYQGAAVRYGEDGYGVYAAGVLVPEMTWGRALQLLRAATSGDWRFIDEMDAWDFMGSCLVNIPGLPVYDGTRIAMKASATTLDPGKAMLVTFSGAPEERSEPIMSGEACSCNKGTKTAAADAAPDAPSFDPVEVQSMIDSAIAANNEAWQSKFDEQFGAVNGRLDNIEPIALDILDRAATSA